MNAERVIKGLECCLGKDDRITYCEQCPYKTEDTVGEYKWPGVCDIDKLHQDALALLKAQEARVMTLDEAKSAFVIEYRSGKLKEAGMKILDLDVDPANAYYGVIYRVWTSRPTDEQREETPWK